MPPRILVVDDQPPIVELVARVLTEEGYDVATAIHGADALRTISTSADFDLVILDMWMPVMNGWQFAAALSAQGRHVPLLVMTAADEARARASEVGAVGFIGKPFNVDQLVSAVSNAISRSAQGHRKHLDAP